MGGWLTGITFTVEEPCAHEPHKTYYRCGVAGVPGNCKCDCPPGHYFGAGMCIEEGATASGPSASEAKGAKAAAAASGTPVTGPAATEEGGYYHEPDEPSEPAEGSRSSTPTGYAPRDPDGPTDEELLAGTSHGKMREMITFDIKDVTARPGNIIREFTISKTSAQLDQEAYGDFYSQYRIDVLADGGNEIRVDKYEVIYSPLEKQKLKSQFGLILDPSKHQNLLNNVFLSFADQMLKTQVRTVESFTHIGQNYYSADAITPDYISDAAPTLQSKASIETRQEKLRAAGAFSMAFAKSMPARAFSRASPAFKDLYGDKAMDIATESAGHFSLFDYASKSQTKMPKMTLSATPSFSGVAIGKVMGRSFGRKSAGAKTSKSSSMKIKRSSGGY